MVFDARTTSVVRALETLHENTCAWKQTERGFCTANGIAFVVQRQSCRQTHSVVEGVRMPRKAARFEVSDVESQNRDLVLSLLQAYGPMGVSDISAKMRTSMARVDAWLADLAATEQIAMMPDGLWGTISQACTAKENRRFLQKAAPVRFCNASTSTDLRTNWMQIRQGGMDASKIRSAGI